MQSYNNNNNKALYEAGRFYTIVPTTFYLTSKDPAYQYQAQKIIQNQVRVSSSLYLEERPTKFDESRLIISIINIYTALYWCVGWCRGYSRRRGYRRCRCGIWC